MIVEDANTLLQTFRRAVADTCKAAAIFNAHLTGTTKEYKAAQQMLDRYLKAEHAAYIACQSGMLDCGCREREQSRADSICTAQRERALDFVEETAREEVR